MNQLLDGHQGVSVGAILAPAHRWARGRHLLFFDPQQPHNRRVLHEIRQGGELFYVLRLHNGYTKSSPFRFWVLEIPSPKAACPRDARSLGASHTMVRLPHILS